MVGYRKVFIATFALAIVCFLAYSAKLDIQASSVIGTISVTFLTANTMVNKRSN